MTMQISRKKFLDLGLGTLGAIGLGACGGDDSGDTGNDTGSSGGDDDDATNTMTDPTIDPDDDGSSSVTVDPSESSSGTDPTAESSGTDTTDPDSSSGPGEDSSSTGTAAQCESDPAATFDLHPHTLDIPLADVIAGVEQSYVAGGGHSHDVTVTAEDFAELLAGNEVVVAAAPGGMDNHPHMVTLICR